MLRKPQKWPEANEWISRHYCLERVLTLETSTLRWIIIIIGALLLGSILLFGNPEKKRKPRASRRREKSGNKRQEPGFDNSPADEDYSVENGSIDSIEAVENPESEHDLKSEQGELDIDDTRPDKPTRPVKARKPAAPAPEKIVSLFVVAQDNHLINGARLLQAAISTGMEFGDMDVFHRVVEGADQSMFSLANAAKPGHFGRDDWNTFETGGVVLFMTLPGPVDALDAWDSMLATARRVGEILNAELLDEEHHLFTRQTEARIREELRTFDRIKS
jgi:cell division protein ZipA